MVRRRSTPWIHRWSRVLIAAIAGLGMVVTGYLTVASFTNTDVACPSEGCDIVLASPWASIFGLPLSLFGLGSYLGILGLALIPLAVQKPEQKELRLKLDETTWFLLFLGGVGMSVFSGYLMYILATAIKAPCPYCFMSAAFSLALLGLTIFGKDWGDRGQLFFTGIIMAVVTLVLTFGIYNSKMASDSDDGPGPPVTTTSGPAEIALARHLTDTGAVMYGAYWCSHCHDQKQLFGKEAAKQIPYIECDANGKDPQVELCQAKAIRGYPTWEINEQMYSGSRPLTELGQLTNYTGSYSFQNIP
ncbi:vitamin K epoxide reductase family protein [Candidatus Synechococcus calcipolaris G9]|uniref:Vitamin K epoxide reductase family protein n=1 Tax=Candidatus Synechococcus calcipolaris G9 TaxID=1497997 RepID=A0ABT6F0G4_9SYNE|nr:vitamin K epoxide reductase family protein [Candidatus Synechococcus calcipolaris]MDG2991312.1 vitamin K epoxide reductase family protein [Candidatus Synechococcus calcipolaris G9]